MDTLGNQDQAPYPPRHPDYHRQAKNHRVIVKRTDHHLAHAANAVHTSPFEDCVVMVIDGAGESDSLSFFHYRRNEFVRLSTTSLSNSLGFLFGWVTELCGFDNWEGEQWKVMGLAAYGKPRSEIYDFFNSRTRVDGLRLKLAFDIFNMDWVQ